MDRDEVRCDDQQTTKRRIVIAQHPFPSNNLDRGSADGGQGVDHRRGASPSRPFATCSLPPHPRPLHFATSSEFESHYHKEHAFRCTLPPFHDDWHPSSREKQAHGEEAPPPPPPQVGPKGSLGLTTRKKTRCGKTFPSDHFLQLHMEECHSVLVRERQERGEKIFACFHPDICSRRFATPKQRRRHLIDVHGYPKTFYFSLPIHGTGELLKRYGPGASLIRAEWRSSKDRVEESDSDESCEDGEEGLADLEPKAMVASDTQNQGGTASKKRKDVESDPEDALPVSPLALPRATETSSAARTDPEPCGSLETASRSGADEENKLAQVMSSLSLVPPSVRNRLQRERRSREMATLL
ncbi:hypothetical protein ACQY0O_005890 [Thecaphora frezii]